MSSHADVLARFSTDFGAPFLRGQPCVIATPLGQDGLLAIRHGLGIDSALAEAVEAQLEHAAHFCDLAPAPFDEDAATLLYAVHDLFACTHPQASAFYARAHLFCRAAAQQVQTLPRTLAPQRLLTRHLVVQRAFSTTRTDAVVSWWTGKAAFYGEDVPPRLTSWPGLRRVQVDQRTTPMWKLALTAGDEELRVARSALLVALLDASPLTRLTLLGDPAQKALGFSLRLPYRVAGRSASPLDALEDRALARAVVDHMMDKGFDISAPPLALTLLQSLREGAPRRALRWAVELCTHLVITACLVEADAPGAREAKPLRAFLDDEVSQMNEALRVFWSVVAASLSLDGITLELPPDGSLPDGARALWGSVKERLAHPKVRAVADPLRRELARRMPPLTATREVDVRA